MKRATLWRFVFASKSKPEDHKLSNNRQTFALKSHAGAINKESDRANALFSCLSRLSIPSTIENTDTGLRLSHHNDHNVANIRTIAYEHGFDLAPLAAAAGAS